MRTEIERELAQTIKALDSLIVRQNRQLLFEISQRENIPLERLDRFLEKFLTSKKCVISL